MARFNQRYERAFVMQAKEDIRCVRVCVCVLLAACVRVTSSRRDVCAGVQPRSVQLGCGERVCVMGCAAP